MIGGLETGDTEVILVARQGGGTTTFRSSTHADRTVMPEFGADLNHGIDLVLGVLREFSEERGEVHHGDRESDDDLG